MRKLVDHRSLARHSLSMASALALCCLFCNPAFCQESEGADPNRPIKDKWAVIIGVSKFSSPKIPQLKYPAKDAQDLYDYFVSKGNFAKDHVLLLKDEKATKVRILDAFGDGWLPRRVLSDDLVLVFISSHGSPADVAGENFVIAHDSDPDRPYATGIRLQDLASELTKRTGCDRIVLLLDACHSGAAVAGQKALLRSSSNFNLDSVAGVGQLVISSSAPDEVSWESKRYPNGVFTRQFIRALENKGPHSQVKEIYKDLKDGVQQEVRFDRVASQSPMMLSKWKGTDLAICAPPSEPRQVLPDLSSADVEPEAKPKPAPAQPQVQVSLPSTKPKPTNSSSGSGSGSFGKAMMVTHWLNSGGDPTLESGTTLLKTDDLSALSSQELLRLYNEAYARHGRGFMLNELQSYFNSQPWYKIDPDYHYKPTDPKVIARKGQTDDPLVINEKRTPKQWANMQLIKKIMDSKK